MSDLPDLDTTSIGPIAYWNVLDQGGLGDIDPTEVTSASGVTSYTLYDNGVEGEFNLGYNSRINKTAKFRVKNDGWFIVWLPNGANFGTRTTTLSSGHWNIAYDWVGSATDINGINQNSLERALHDLFLELSNSGTANYYSSDVGLFAYDYDTATNATVLYAQQLSKDFSSGNYFSSQSADFQYTSDTDRHFHAVCGVAWQGDRDYHGRVEFNGTELCDTADESPGSASPSFGFVDAVTNDIVSSSGTTYTGTAYACSDGDEKNTEDDESAALMQVVFWS